MKIISASSYSNTAPLIWSFLYGSQRGKYDLLLDTAPARSAELLSNDAIDAALVPVIASKKIEGVRIIPDVCVGARNRVRSVCLITSGMDISDVKSVALDTSSKTSVVLTKIIFREFLGSEPKWTDAPPDISQMLEVHDCALLIGDPALSLSGSAGTDSSVRIFDLVELWNRFTGLGFVFAMWMTRRDDCDIDFAGARDEGLEHIEQIIGNYSDEHLLPEDEFREYLSANISYSVDDSMRKGMELFFKLAAGVG